LTTPHPGVILQKTGEKTPGSSDFWDALRRKSASLQKRIIFPESADPRVLSAASFLSREGIARPVLLGASAPDGMEAMDLTAEERKAFAAKLFERKKARGLTEDAARALMEDPLHRAAALLAQGRVDGFVGGAVRSTADTVRAAFACVGPAEGNRSVFGAFFMECPNASTLTGTKLILFADAAVSPHPSPRALAVTAVESAAFFKRFTGQEPRAAFLSFSTKGSAEDEAVTAAREAADLARKKAPDLAIDGELQADAALVEWIARQKGVTDFSVAGKANVLIFPDLNAGNIAYKMVQHLGGARAVGPALVGMARPMADLSRGCSDEDIVDTAALVSLM
jgi:phosphate acetyltransferase